MSTENNPDKIRRLNLILNALRDIGKLINTQKNKQNLIKGICNILVETRGYYNAWIGLLDENKDLMMIAQAGVGDKFGAMKDQIKEKK